MVEFGFTMMRYKIVKLRSGWNDSMGIDGIVTKEIVFFDMVPIRESSLSSILWNLFKQNTQINSSIK